MFIPTFSAIDNMLSIHIYGPNSIQPSRQKDFELAQFLSDLSAKLPRCAMQRVTAFRPFETFD